MRKLLYILFVSFIMLACKTQKNAGSSSTSSEETKLLISYEQTSETNGKSAEYKIELYSNRQMYLNAIKNLDKSGKYMRTVSEKEFNNILASFNKADFFSFNNEYFTDSSDTPVKYLYYTYSGKEKKVKHNVGAPDELTELDFMVQSFLDRVGWEKLAW